MPVKGSSVRSRRRADDIVVFPVRERREIDHDRPPRFAKGAFKLAKALGLAIPRSLLLQADA